MIEEDPTIKSLTREQRNTLRDIMSSLISSGVAQKYYKHLELETKLEQTDVDTFAAEVAIAVKTYINEDLKQTSYNLVKINPISGEHLDNSEIVVGEIAQDGTAHLTSTVLGNDVFDFKIEDITVIQKVHELQSQAGIIIN